MFSIAESLSKNNEVTVFWDDRDILKKASERFGLSLEKVTVVKNIFKDSSLPRKIAKTLSYDKIIYLSDGSVPLISPQKLLLHFQVPIIKKNVPSIQRLKVRLARRVFCNSQFTKKIIDNTYGIDSLILYPPVKEFEYSEKKKQNLILTVGRFQPFENDTDFKKISFMIDAFKKLKERKGWKFKIITVVSKEYDEKFKKLKEKENENIEIIKNVDLNTVKDAYNTAKIYWHAAGFGEDVEAYPERMEHFGISTVEAMSAGCVPVVINMGGQKEIVNEKCGYLWDTESELLDFTQKVMTDENLRIKLAKESKRVSQKFSAENFKNNLERIVES